MDYLKASILVSTSCSVALIGIAAYTAKQSRVLNQTIAAGMQQIADDRKALKLTVNPKK